jgi:hypothetical protein
MKIRNSDIKALTESKRRILIEHVDGPIPISRNNSSRIHTINALLGLGLLRNESPGPMPAKPRALMLTEAGRWAVSLLLAGYAEDLVRAGCLDAEPLTPLMILQRLKAARKPAVSASVALEPARIAISALEK